MRASQWLVWSIASIATLTPRNNGRCTGISPSEAVAQQERGSMAAEVTLRGADGIAEWAEEVAAEEGERGQVPEPLAYAQANG